MFNTIATPKTAYVLFDHCFNNAIDQDITAITKVANIFSEHIDKVVFRLVNKFNNAMAQTFAKQYSKIRCIIYAALLQFRCFFK